MKMDFRSAILLLLLAFIATLSRAIELTFELPDNANQCFYEEIKQGIDSTIEFQVSSFSIAHACVLHVHFSFLVFLTSFPT